MVFTGAGMADTNTSKSLTIAAFFASLRFQGGNGLEACPATSWDSGFLIELVATLTLFLPLIEMTLSFVAGVST